MKENKYTQCILCEGDTFQEAVDKFNEAMRENAAFSPTFERAGEAFLVYIKVVERAPETIVEAKQLEGCRHHCEDCSHCKRERNRFGEVDKRKKKAYCDLHERRTMTSMVVCDSFYLEHQDERGEVING